MKAVSASTMKNKMWEKDIHVNNPYDARLLKSLPIRDGLNQIDNNFATYTTAASLNLQ